MGKINRTVLHDYVPTIQLFSTGGVVRSRTDFFMDVDSNLWKYIGELPTNVKAGDVPSTSDWVQITNKPQKQEDKYSNVLHFRDFGGVDGLNEGLHKVAHDFCNKHGFVLSYEGMKLEITDREIVVKRPVIFKCEMTIIVNEVNKGKNVFLFSEARWYDITLDFDYKEYSNRPFKDLSGIPTMSWIRWRPSVKHTNGQYKEIQEFCVHTSDGSVTGRTFSDFKGSVVGGYRKISNNRYSFQDLVVNIQDETGQTGGNYFIVFKLSDLDNVYIDNFMLGKQTPVNNPKAIFDIGGCFGVFISNIKSTGVYSLSASTFGYIFDIWNSVNINFEDITGNVVTKNWWSLYGANRVKVVNHRNCHFYRYDNHSFLQDVYAENCTTRGSALSGNGFRRFINCDFVFTEEESIGNLFQLRGLSQNGNYASFNGDIYISGGSLSGEVQEFYFVNCQPLGNVDALNNSVFNSFVMDGVNFDRLKYKSSAAVLPYRAVQRDLIKRFELRNVTVPTPFIGFCRDEKTFINSGETVSLDFYNVKFVQPNGYTEVNAKKWEMGAQFPSGTKGRIRFVNCEHVGCWSSNVSMEFINSTVHAARSTTNGVNDVFVFKNCTVLDTVPDNILLSNSKVESTGCTIRGSMLSSSSSTDLYEYLHNSATLVSAHVVFGKVFPNYNDAKLYARPFTSLYVSSEGAGTYFKRTAQQDLVFIG